MNTKEKKSKRGVPHPKASDAKIELRLLEILQIKLDGAEPWNVLQYCSEKQALGQEPWKLAPGQKPLSERQIRDYMARADERIAGLCHEQSKNSLHLHFAQRRGLYARAVQAGDLRTALAVLQDLAALANLYPAKTTKTELTGRDGGKIEMQAEVVDSRARILEFADEFRQAAERTIMESAEQGGDPGDDPAGHGIAGVVA